MNRTDEADRLLRRIVLDRRQCQRCGAVRDPACMDTAHIVRRGYAATRCDEDNVWLLCHEPCHRLVDSSTIEHAALVARTIGDDHYRGLYARAYAGPPLPLTLWWPAERARLRARCKELGLSLRGAA